MPLVDTGLIVRYYIDEAASGQTPTEVLVGTFYVSPSVTSLEKGIDGFPRCFE